jgi:4-hydroxy-tetrahydrodipicolinate synthase
MTSTPDLRGVWIPLVTPFSRADEVDHAALERLVHEVVDAGVAGIVALGTTGEAHALDHDERDAVIATCSRVCAERGVGLIVGAGTYDTRTTIAYHEALRDVPAVVAALTVVPYYVRPSEAAVVEHLRAVAAASPVPVVVYNIPVRTGRGLGARSLLELAAVPGIVGVKQAVGGVDVDTLAVLAEAPAGFAVLCGDDPFILPMVLMGGAGAIVASAHVATERFVAMVECGLHGKLDDARGHAEVLLPLVEALFAEPNPAVIKGVLHAQGRISTAAVRGPLADGSHGAVAAALSAASRAAG